MLTKQQQERFDQFLKEHGEWENPSPVEYREFFENELSLQLSEIIETAEGMKDYKNGHPEKEDYRKCVCGYGYDDCMCDRNDGLQDLISTLTTLQEGK